MTSNPAGEDVRASIISRDDHDDASAAVAPDASTQAIGRSFDNEFVAGSTYGDFVTAHAMYARLRREDPVHWAQPDGFRPFWLLTKNVDILEVERQNDLFLNSPRQRLQSIAHEQRVLAEMKGLPHLTRSLHVHDGEEHRALRAITAKWFLPKQIRQLEPRIAALAQKAFDTLEAKGGRSEFYHEVAAWYPLEVLLTIMGLPIEDAPLLKELTGSIFAGDDAEVATKGDPIEATRLFRAYFDAVAADRAANPRDDVASLIANAELSGRPITQYESSSYYIALATAGHDTTSAVIAGGVLAFAQHPYQWRLLQERPQLIDQAVEEILRWVSPTKHFFRTATEDYVLRGRSIRAGDSLMLAFPSANRDEDIFEQPYAFDIERKPNRHVAFGHGVHMCLGMILARLEVKLFLQEMLKRADDVQLDGPVTWVRTAFVGGVKRLPVRFALKSS